MSTCFGMDVRLYNVIVLGVAFMMIFTAFQTASMSEESVVNSARNESQYNNGTFEGEGYSSLSVIYITLALCNWLGPVMVAWIGTKMAMFLGSLPYLLFILSFLKPMTWSLYTSSVLVGLGGAVLWNAQGKFLTVNSDYITISRNSGIFWAVFQCSLFFGNAYCYFVLEGKDTIAEHERTQLFIGLGIASLIGSLLLLMLRPRHRLGMDDIDIFYQAYSDEQGLSSVIPTLKRALSLMKRKHVVLLSVTTAYAGLEQTFFSGVYGTCISNNQHFGHEAKGLLGISGMFIGAGEIIGGSLFGLLGRSTHRHGRDVIVCFSYIVHVTCFYLIYLNMPNHSPSQFSDEDTHITSNIYLALFCSFLLGFGDSGYNTQRFSLVGFLYAEDSALAFALFSFLQSVWAGIGFYYSSYLLLQYQLLILIVMATAGFLTFSIVEWDSTKMFQETYQMIG